MNRIMKLAVAVAVTMMATASFAALDPDPGWASNDTVDFNSVAAVEPSETPAEMPVLAHAGQLSPKDGCHNHKAAGERHWHEDGTSERGGPCVKKNGATEKFRGNALCLDERLHMTKLIEDYWNTTGDWEDMARALRACIQGL